MPKKTLTIAWNILQKAREVYTFVTKMVVPSPLAFNVNFEGVPVIWVKQSLVSEVLRCTGRLRKLYIDSWGFKRHFLRPLHFLHPLSGGCRTRLSISSWDEQACLGFGAWFISFSTSHLISWIWCFPNSEFWIQIPFLILPNGFDGWFHFI